MSAFRRRRYRSELAVETLEPRTLLALTVPDAASPPSIAGDPDTGPPVALVAAAVSSAATTGADTPWLTYAAQCTQGTLVARFLVTPAADGQGDPTVKVDLIQATFNAPSQSAVAPGQTPFDAPADAKVEGMVFPGQGVAVLPTDTWPKSIESFDAYKPPADSGPQEFFVVIQSDSNVTLGACCFFLSLLSDPSFQNGTGTGTGSGGGIGPGGQDADGLSQAFGALAAFALLAGAGDQTAPTVSLESDTGTFDTDGVTRDGRLKVDAPSGSKVEYSIDGGSTWRSSFRAREGRNDVQVRTLHSSGSQWTQGFSFTLDTRSPAAPRVALQNDTGRSATDGVTNDPGLVIRNQEPDAAIEYSVNGGPWTATYAPVEGRNRVRFRQIDLAGNVSKPSKPFVFRLDTRVDPLFPVVFAQATQSGAVAGSRPQRFTGAEWRAEIQYSLDGGQTWVRKQPYAALRGQVLVRQIDLAGNISAVAGFTS